MPELPALFHMTVGGIGLLSGAGALLARKGSQPHRWIGTVFFIAMMTTAASGAYLGFAGNSLGNAVAGIVTLYLLSTAWVAVRRAEGETGLFEIGAFLFAAAASVAAFYAAIMDILSGTPFLGGIPYTTIASIVTLAALCDLSVVLRRGLRGKQRLARHLWRMILGFSAAVGSFFPGQLEIFPAYVREVKPFILLFVPFFSIIGMMVVWLIVVLFTGWYRRSQHQWMSSGEIAAAEQR